VIRKTFVTKILLVIRHHWSFFIAIEELFLINCAYSNSLSVLGASVTHYFFCKFAGYRQETNC